MFRPSPGDDLLCLKCVMPARARGDGIPVPIGQPLPASGHRLAVPPAASKTDMSVTAQEMSP